MKPLKPVIVFLFLLILNSHAYAGLKNDVEKFLRFKVSNYEEKGAMAVSNIILHEPALISEFYRMRAYNPAWTTDYGIDTLSNGLTDMIAYARYHGLNPIDYHIERIQQNLALLKNNDTKRKSRVSAIEATETELLLTDAWMTLARHFLAGKLNPETLAGNCEALCDEVDLVVWLDNSISERNIRDRLYQLLPQEKSYRQLQEMYLGYMAIAESGGWPMVDTGETLQPGDTSLRIWQTRERLKITGELDVDDKRQNEIFDEQLEQAVMQFQKNHGLVATGNLNGITIAEMNVPVSNRLEQIRLNLERIRWLPHKFAGRYIMVNIADFKLAVRENDSTTLVMKAIVGRTYRKTPVFSARLSYMVINPTWTVPVNIAVNDKLPLIKKNPGYLAKSYMKLYSGWGASATEVDPYSVDWQKVNASNFRYKIVQMPGPDNALGELKFMFPNKYDVYIHDTPTRELFLQSQRTFSSGCIRIENPIGLAEYLLNDKGDWDRDKILSIIKTRVETRVNLENPLPVYLQYLTAFISESGRLQFRKDIYDRDAEVIERLNEQILTYQ